jgi:hypothetical protein
MYRSVLQCDDFSLLGFYNGKIGIKPCQIKRMLFEIVGWNWSRRQCHRQPRDYRSGIHPAHKKKVVWQAEERQALLRQEKAYGG